MKKGVMQNYEQSKKGVSQNHKQGKKVYLRLSFQIFIVSYPKMHKNLNQSPDLQAKMLDFEIRCKINSLLHFLLHILGYFVNLGTEVI